MFRSLVFLAVAYSDSLQQCLTSSRSKTHVKRFWYPNLCQRGQNRQETSFFCHFLKFVLAVFFKISDNNSWQQCLTSSRGKIQKKYFWSPNLAKETKIRPKTRGFFCHSLKFGSLVFLEIAYNDR